MSLASQFKDLQTRGAQFRRDIFGECTVEFFSGKITGAPAFTCSGYHSPFRRMLKSETVGFLQPHDAVVRISRTAGFTPEIDKFIRVTLKDAARTQFQMRIVEIPHHAAGAEWVLGCKAIL